MLRKTAVFSAVFFSVFRQLYGICCFGESFSETFSEGLIFYNNMFKMLCQQKPLDIDWKICKY